MSKYIQNPEYSLAHSAFTTVLLLLLLSINIMTDSFLKYFSMNKTKVKTVTHDKKKT